jgi:hypothetical protein
LKSALVRDTHLHFYTHHTADRYLLSESPDLRLVTKVSDGWVPFSGVYRRLIGERRARAIDQWGLSHRPYVFGSQIGSLRCKD